MNKIDIFCHIMPQKFLKEYMRTQIPPLIRFLDTAVNSEDRYRTSVDARVEYMKKFGIEIQALTVSQAGNIWQTLDYKEALRMTRVANDSLAEITKDNPETTLGNALLPNIQGDFLDELERAITELGMKGCMVYSNVNGLPLDSPEFADFFAKMSKYDLPIFIHPTNWKYYGWIRTYKLDQIFGWPFDTSLAMAHIVFGGIFQRFPNLKIVVHHMGGMIPFYAERIRTFYEDTMDQPLLEEPSLFPHSPGSGKNPLDLFRKFYGDTVLNGNVSAAKCGCDFFGPDHVVFATDYPFGAKNGEAWTQGAIRSVEELEISQEEKSKIFEKNARRILKLE